MSHQGTRPKQCRSCGQLFATNYNLQRHISRRASCETFYNRTHRETTETSIDIFSRLPVLISTICPFCSRDFQNVSSMRRHARHNCPVHRDLMNEHINNIHCELNNLHKYLTQDETADLSGAITRISNIIETYNLQNISC